jgi:hypothetical protein
VCGNDYYLFGERLKRRKKTHAKLSLHWSGDSNFNKFAVATFSPICI